MRFQNPILDFLVSTAEAASVEVMDVYRRPFKVDFKTPEDPITEADRRANQLIVERLHAKFPEIPLVAEETPPEKWGERKQASKIFFVDPVDGTREFVDRNGQFAVMIGMVDGQHPTLGVVLAPALALAWVASPEDGALKFDFQGKSSLREVPAQVISVSQQAELSEATFVVSKRFSGEKGRRLAEKIRPEKRVFMGGAGLKAMCVAEGKGDVYATPTHQGCRWDCCAPEAIIRAAGGSYSDGHGAPLDYRTVSVKNDSGIVATNALLKEACVQALKPLM